MRIFLVLLFAAFGAGLFLAGSVYASSKDSAACDFDHLEGKPYSVELLGDIGERPVRVMGPETMVTMDHVPGRINVLIDSDTNVIIAVACD